MQLVNPCQNDNHDLQEDQYLLELGQSNMLILITKCRTQQDRMSLPLVGTIQYLYFLSNRSRHLFSVDSVVNHSQVPLNCGAIVPRVSFTNLMDVATLGL